MKLTISTIALAALVAIASLSQTAHAQTGRHSAQVKVPFSFDCGTQHFAPGVYTISMRDQNILVLKGKTGSAWTMIHTGYDPTQLKVGSVIFRKYGERYFLTEYRPVSGSIDVTVFESEPEHRAARDFAENHLAATHVQLALLSNESSQAQAK